MSWQGTDVRTFARQRVLFCHCGQFTLYAAGKCLRCYSRDKRNERHYAGLREVVLKRDGYRCRTCPFTPTAEGERRLLVVHHRQPGVSELPRMLTLCAACHARVVRTKFRPAKARNEAKGRVHSQIRPFERATAGFYRLLEEAHRA